MNSFEIIKLNEGKIEVLIVMKTNDSPFEYVDELQNRLTEINFSGIFVIDSLLHSGNTEERFISGFFDGIMFDKTKFKFENIERKSDIRNYICEYLRTNYDLLLYSGLTTSQQRLILKGYAI